MRIYTLLILFLFLFPVVSIGDVIGIATFSESSVQSSDELENCIFESLKEEKPHYLKRIETHQPFNATIFGQIGRKDRIDVIYHYHLYQKDDRLLLEMTQYHVTLQKITGRELKPLDQLRPCDESVFLTLDYLDKEPTFKENSKPYIYQARELAGQGRFDDAGSYYTQAAKILPNAGCIYREMGQYLQNGNRPYWAMEWYRLAIKLDDHELESYFRMAEIYKNLYTSEEAVTYLLQSLDRGAKPPQLYMRLGTLYEELGNIELAWQYYEKAFKLDPSNPDTLIKLKRTLTENRQWAKAADYQLLFIKAHPNDAAARTELLEMYLEAENYNAAIQILKEYIKISPNESAWVSRLGRAYLGLQNLDKAREQYIRLLELDPGNGSAYLALGKIDYQQKHFDQAKVNLKYALADYEANVDALRMLGRILEWEKDYAQAIEIQKKIIMYEDTVKDGDLLRLFALGRKADLTSQVEASVNDLIRYKSRADGRKLIMAMAIAMVEDGRKAQAERYLQSKMYRLTGHAPAYLLLGNLLVEDGKYEQADRIFMGAVFATPDSTVPLKVALLYHKLDRFEQAEYFYRFATNRNEGGAKILLQYLEVTLINGHLDESLWTIYDVKDRELPPLYQMWLSYLQIVWAKMKGDDAYYQNALQYGLELMKHHGQPTRLDFEDFRPVIQAKFDEPERTLLWDITSLYEGKLPLEKFRQKYNL